MVGSAWCERQLCSSSQLRPSLVQSAALAPAPQLLRVALGKGPVYSVVHITSKFQPLKYNPFGHSYITTLFFSFHFFSLSHFVKKNKVFWVFSGFVSSDFPSFFWACGEHGGSWATSYWIPRKRHIAKIMANSSIASTPMARAPARYTYVSKEFRITV